jgi:3-dehydroquinate synthase
MEVFRKLLDIGADRSSFILGVGGGIVTDITGFVASTYMRGVDFGFIPTTLLAQVDAAIGGKNGVNLDGYKNIVGVFNQPQFVICDSAMLRTLPERELRSGLAEIIKAGIIGDAALFDLFEKHTFEDITGNADLLEEMILRAIKVKVALVEGDERETGTRKLLNLGHTFAHAMEKNTPLYSHGEAVAAGIALISDAAARLGKLSSGDAARISNVIEKMGLPTRYPVEIKKLLAATRFDKKKERETIHIVHPTAIGRCETEKVPFEKLEQVFQIEN